MATKVTIGYWSPVLSLLFSATIWGVVWYPIRLLDKAGLSGLWLTFLSYAAAFLPVLLYYWKLGADPRTKPGPLVVLGLASGWCNLAFVLAMIEGLVMRVLLLFYLSPVWTVLMGRLILKERLSPATIAVLLVAMTGALLMLWDGGTGFPWPRSRADWLALSSGFTFAVANVMVRYLQAVSITGKTLVSWAGVVIMSLLGILITQDVAPGLAWRPLAGAAALGWFGFLIATFALQYGVTRLPVQRSAVILLFELVAGGVSAAWLADELLSAREWFGGALIIGAGYLAVRKPEP